MWYSSDVNCSTGASSYNVFVRSVGNVNCKKSTYIQLQISTPSLVTVTPDSTLPLLLLLLRTIVHQGASGEPKAAHAAV
jgi:hypothetical protein